MQINRAVSVYWLWFVVIGGILAIIPNPPGFGAKIPNIAEVYASCDLRPEIVNRNQVILVHTTVSVVLAVAVTVILQRRANRRQRRWEYHPDPKSLTLSDLLLFVAAIAFIFSILASIGATSVVYIAVLIAVVGRIAALLLVAVAI
jgi:hypothetical protein